ncbi:hypothetical protein [Mycobacteroides abscessus]|uniref:hypothetical protein n=1 Tax=Mycobacteroides abscessus TaxID=36809 RepID=UPI0005E1672B|nr:hypothetical protein [Mycobacteroides abscessus]CPW66779.1 Uncharacterised protein [Mycobacteroides abscessus]SKF61945.1 Uncharacterised protein [Mycobacteroides abscessus subsp. bolletii]SKH89188.1 Uncharacterised protein [Mycobacteroides abscessus subsp. bolletii]
MSVAVSRIATERPNHRRTSKIGSEQRHYDLEPGLILARGEFSSVVVASGAKAVYVYAADKNGAIADYETLAIVVNAEDPEGALSQLGYKVDSATDSGDAA